ncbi:hypothetical protein [Streptomyces hirsutus]|uniref:hypothetical protein n=1 Tax=Streptomyces hirsutus TaxID=35620 RepID=UPI0006E2FFB4|nr:hypothetical protein [Streptomyces hirsutus]
MEWRTFGQLLIFFGVLGGPLILLIGMDVDPWTALKLIGALVGLVRGLFALTPHQESSTRTAKGGETEGGGMRSAIGPRGNARASAAPPQGAHEGGGDPEGFGPMQDADSTEPEGDARS